MNTLESHSIGFIGLGAMGQKMALHLLDKGYGLSVYDPNPNLNALTPLLERGAHSHNRSPMDANKASMRCPITPC